MLNEIHFEKKQKFFVILFMFNEFFEGALKESCLKYFKKRRIMINFKISLK
jgi:hypothetical protein